MDMTRSEFVWAITIATFLAMALTPILLLYIIEVIRLNLGSGKGGHRIEERRRSKRFEVSLPVFVYGHESNAEPFTEEATVLQVSAHGGLLTLATKVRIGQELLLATNGALAHHQPCWVARLGSSNGLRTEAGVKFARPAPEFWLTQVKQS